MKKKNTPKIPVDLETKQLEKKLITYSIRLESTIQLLIENGFFSKESFDAKIQEVSKIVAGSRQKIVSVEKPPEIQSAPPPPNPPIWRERTEWIIDKPKIIKSNTFKVLPNKLILMKDQIVCDDPQSANAICAPCIAQNTIMIESFGVKDICSLPTLITHKKKSRHETLEGVHRRCWMYDIADKILEAEEQRLIRSEIVPRLLIKAIRQVITAIEQNIAPEGIGSIIDCVLLEEQTEENEATSEDKSSSRYDNGIYDDINWQH